MERIDMKRHTLARAFLLMLTFLSGAFAEDKYIVRADPAALNLLAQIYSHFGVRITSSLDNSGQVAAIGLPSGPLGTWIASLLKQNPIIQSIEPDLPVKLPVKTGGALPGSALPRVPAMSGPKTASYGGTAVWGPYVNQPAVDIIGLRGAQRYATGRGTLVATIDTGVDFSHPALRAVLVPGADFTRAWGIGDEAADLNQETTPILDQETTPILDGAGTVVLNQETTPILDQETTPILDSRLPASLGHGTMVAGLIHLVAPGAQILPVKAFDATGSAPLSHVIMGIYYAVARGADVINMSFSTLNGSAEFKRAIAFATSRGVICVTSAGNEGQMLNTYPAAYDSTIGVGSTNNRDMRSAFSNYGDTVELAAPGEGLITTYPRNRYAAGWGTSFSAPIVAGGAALLVELNGRISIAAATKDLLQAVPVGQGLGAGRLDLSKAISYQLSNQGR
jgi:subtilisin family serine protease